MTKLTYSRFGKADLSVGWLAGVPAIARAVAVPLGIVALALLLRTWRFDLQTWTPDTYEQLAASRRLVAADFPLSGLYPPGVAATMAPFFLFLPQSLATMQVVIIGSSLVLIALSYALVLKATGDRFAAALFAGALAIMPQFVYFSRDCLFDIVGTTWIISSILLVPVMRGRGLAWFALYGLMLGITVNVRATDAAMLPALLIYWCASGGAPFTPRALLGRVLQRELVLAGAVLVAVSAIFAYIGGWTGTATGAPITFATVGAHIPFYLAAELGMTSGVIIAPLAALGARELWIRNRPLLLAAAYILAVWPVAHAPLPFANGRYMLPGLALALLLAAHAPASIARMAPGLRERRGATAMRAALGAMALLALVWFAVDAVMLYRWPTAAAQSNEAAYRQLRPVIAGLPDGSMLVSAGTRGVIGSSPRIQYVDLIDYSLPAGNTPERVQAMVDRIGQARARGVPVYYLYTYFEHEKDNMGNGGPAFDAYYDAVTARFHLTETFRADEPYYILYRID
jgi:hypothetical protein